METKPQAIVFQLTTNDVKTLQNTNEIVQDFSDLVKQVQEKLPLTKIVISQAPNKFNSTRMSTRIAAVNATLADIYQDISVT